MDPSKPPSDIGAPSKASSDIDCPKARSDIGVSTQSMHQLDYKPTLKTAVATCESNESNVPQQSAEARPIKSDPVGRKLVAKAVPEAAVAPVEAAPRLEQARVAAKRGKLVRSASSSHASPRDPRTRARPPNPREIGEGTRAAASRVVVPFASEKHRLSASERSKLRAASQRHRRQRDDSRTVISRATDVSLGIAVRDYIRDARGRVRVCQKSQALTDFQRKPGSRDGREASVSLGNRELVIANESSRSVCDIRREIDRTSKRSSRTQAAASPEAGKSNVDLTSEREIPKSRYGSGFSRSDRYHGKISAHSMSFRSGPTVSGEAQLARPVEKPALTSSQSFRSRYSRTPVPSESASRSPRLGRLSVRATRCRANSVASASDSRARPCNFAERYAESNLSPPPLSGLQIFAISTGPLDIQVTSTDSIPSDIDELPSLPIINHAEGKAEERKLSILEPPPPGLVSRQESNESWNRFLIQLNSILESRAGEFV